MAIKKANAGDDASVGVLAALLLGLRASEVTDRVVRDLDDDGRLLWIEFGKTRRARRTLEVPLVLRPYLLALAEGRGPDEQLITRKPLRTGKKADRYWLMRETRRLCTDAKTPRVCVHSLRGLHATLATEAGATSRAVAGALGHSTPAVTQAHYIDGTAKRRANSKRVVNALAPAQPEPRPERPTQRPTKRAAKRPKEPSMAASEGAFNRAPDAARAEPCLSRRKRGMRGELGTAFEFPNEPKGFSKLWPLLQVGESSGASGGTRTRTRLSTGT